MPAMARIVRLAVADLSVLVGHGRSLSCLSTTVSQILIVPLSRLQLAVRRPNSSDCRSPVKKRDSSKLPIAPRSEALRYESHQHDRNRYRLLRRDARPAFEGPARKK